MLCSATNNVNAFSLFFHNHIEILTWLLLLLCLLTWTQTNTFFTLAHFHQFNILCNLSRSVDFLVEWIVLLFCNSAITRISGGGGGGWKCLTRELQQQIQWPFFLLCLCLGSFIHSFLFCSRSFFPSFSFLWHTFLLFFSSTSLKWYGVELIWWSSSWDDDTITFTFLLCVHISLYFLSSFMHACFFSFMMIMMPYMPIS